MTDAPATSAEAAPTIVAAGTGSRPASRCGSSSSLGLLPLGIIAVIASVENARANRDKAEVEARALLAVHVQRFTLALSRNAFTIRAARDAIIEARDPAGICARTLRRLGRSPNTPRPLRPLRRRRRSRAACRRASRRRAAPPAEGEIGRGVDHARRRGARHLPLRSGRRARGHRRISPRGARPRGRHAADAPAISRSSWSRATG